MLQISRNTDVELAPSSVPTDIPPPYLPGLPSFAAFVASDADAAIYRKYECLSARNLLYLQSELHELEQQLQELDARDVRDKNIRDQEAQKIARRWNYYSQDGGDRATEHRNLQEKIRVKIKEYRNVNVMLAEISRD